MIELGDFVLMRRWYSNKPDRGDLICLYAKSISSSFNFTLYPFATKSQVNSRPFLKYNAGWNITKLPQYNHSEVTIPDIIRCDLFNDTFLPEFKIFFRKLIEKEFPNESPKYAYSINTRSKGGAY